MGFMNRVAMMELIDHLETLPPEQFDMKDIVATKDNSRQEVALQSHEDVTCCIIGEKILLDGWTIRFTDYELLVNGTKVDMLEYAREALGLSSVQAICLFYDLSLKTPNQAAQRIREMLDE